MRLTETFDLSAHMEEWTGSRDNWTTEDLVWTAANDGGELIKHINELPEDVRRHLDLDQVEKDRISYERDRNPHGFDRRAAVEASLENPGNPYAALGRRRLR